MSTRFWLRCSRQRGNRVLESILDETLAAFDAALGRRAPLLQLEETGVVIQVSSGIARVSGLPGLKSEELVAFPGGLQGIAINLERPFEIGHWIKVEQYLFPIKDALMDPIHL